MKLLHTQDDINKAIDSIRNRGARLDADIQIAAVSTTLHAVLHGDCILINRLISAMPNGSRVNALRAWFETFAPVEYSEKSKEFTLHKANAAQQRTDCEASEDGLCADIRAGMLEMWTSLKPEPDYKPTDLTKMLAKLVADANKRMKANKGDKIDPVLLAKISAFVTN